MTDERLTELKDARDKATDEHKAMCAHMDKMQKRLREIAQESTKLQGAHQELRHPRNVLAEQIASLSSEIKAEETRRAEEAAAAKAQEAEAEAESEKQPE